MKAGAPCKASTTARCTNATPPTPQTARSTCARTTPSAKAACTNAGATPPISPTQSPYATAYARISEHPKVKAALSTPFDPEKEPQAIRDIPIDEILGSDGHTAIYGYELVGDDMKQATKQRQMWMRAIRDAIDDGMTFDEATESVRSTAAANNRHEPSVRGIDTFAGGTFTVQFDANRAENGYEILSFYASPRRDER